MVAFNTIAPRARIGRLAEDAEVVAVRIAPPDTLRFDYRGPFGRSGAAVIVADSALWVVPQRDARELLPAAPVFWAALGIPQPPPRDARLSGREAAEDGTPSPVGRGLGITMPMLGMVSGEKGDCDASSGRVFDARCYLQGRTALADQDRNIVWTAQQPSCQPCPVIVLTARLMVMER